MSGDTTESIVSNHYGSWSLIDTIERALRDAGLDPAHITVEQLAPLDNFHSFGPAGTAELERHAGITSGDRVLDVGGGVGGPARSLASHIGCHVTVLDLTPEFCRAGEALTAWTHLSDRVSFACASALDMPFADGSFDAAWTQHASMNISDKPRLFAEIHRVLRPGGRFALFDIMAGPQQPIHFPVPWANDQTYSFLLPPDEIRSLIGAAGFIERFWLAGPELTSRLEQGAPNAVVPGTAGAPTGQLSVALLMGADAEAKLGNTVRNTREGRMTAGMGVFERA